MDLVERAFAHVRLGLRGKLGLSFIHSFIQFIRLSYERSVAFSKAICPQGAMSCFLFQFPISFPWGHPVAAYTFFFVFPSFLFFPLTYLQSRGFRRQCSGLKERITSAVKIESLLLRLLPPLPPPTLRPTRPLSQYVQGARFQGLRRPRSKGGNCHVMPELRMLGTI
jgi:hypothetical protein